MKITKQSFLIFSLFILLLPTSIPAQTKEIGYSSKLDSLLLLYAELPTSIVIDSLYENAKKVMANVDYESGFIYSQKAYDLSLNQKDKNQSLKVLDIWSNNSLVLNKDSEKLFKIIEEELELARAKGTPKQLAKLLIMISKHYYMQGASAKMANVLLEAINIYNELTTEQEQFNFEKANLYVSLALNMNIVDRAKTKDYFEKALEYAKLAQHASMIQVAAINLGQSYMEMEQYDEGIALLKDLVADYPNMGKGKKSSVHRALGRAYMLTAQTIPAEFHLRTALELADKSPITKNFILTDLSELLSVQKKFPEAIKYGLMPLQDYIKENNLLAQANAYAALHKAYAGANNFKKAYAYQTKFTAVSDTIVKRERENELLKLSTEFETIQKDQEIRILSQKNRISNLLMSLLFVGLFSLTALSFLYYKKWRISQALKKEREKHHLQLMNEKERTLARLALSSQQKNDYIDQIKTKVETLAKSQNSSGKELHALVRELANAADSDESVQKFLFHFEKVHPSFFRKLRANYKKLTTLDLKHCAFIKLNLDTKDIANMLHVDPKSVQMARYRIKKKLDLAKKDSLSSFLANF